MNMREECTGKVDSLLKEAAVQDSATKTFNETKVTKISRQF